MFDFVKKATDWVGDAAAMPFKAVKAGADAIGDAGEWAAKKTGEAVWDMGEAVVEGAFDYADSQESQDEDLEEDHADMIRDEYEYWKDYAEEARSDLREIADSDGNLEENLSYADTAASQGISANNRNQERMAGKFGLQDERSETSINRQNARMKSSARSRARDDSEELKRQAMGA